MTRRAALMRFGILGFGILVFGVLGFAARCALADGTYVKEGGGVVVPLPNADVQLVWETIDLAVERKGLLSADDTIVVSVTYLFRNLTDRKVSLSMGFPVGWDLREQYWQAGGYVDRQRSSPVSGFTTTIDERSVRVRLRPPRVPRLKPLHDDEEADPRREGEPDEFGALQYYVWRVTFGPKQEHTVVNRFRYDATAGVYWEENLFRYVLRSGAAWAGPIERATIRFRLGDRGCLRKEGPDSCIEGLEELRGFQEDPFRFAGDTAGVTPEGATVRQAPDGTTEVVWDLRDFEPDEDIAFGYETARAARAAVRSAIAALDLARTEPDVLQDARDTLLALQGLRFDDPATQARFAARSWYVVDPAMTHARASKDPLVRAITKALAARPPAATPSAAPPSPDLADPLRNRK